MEKVEAKKWYTYEKMEIGLWLEVMKKSTKKLPQLKPKSPQVVLTEPPTVNQFLKPTFCPLGSDMMKAF